MTALNNSEMQRQQWIGAVVDHLIKAGMDQGLALALADERTTDEADLSPAEAAALYQQLPPREMFDRFLQHEGIYGFTQKIINTVLHIQRISGPINETAWRL